MPTTATASEVMALGRFKFHLCTTFAPDEFRENIERAEQLLGSTNAWAFDPGPLKHLVGTEAQEDLIDLSDFGATQIKLAGIVINHSASEASYVLEVDIEGFADSDSDDLNQLPLGSNIYIHAVDTF